MKAPEQPADEARRLDKLESLKLLHSPMEARFDRFTEMAKNAFGVPIVLISLVGKDIQWFKSAQGLSAPSTSRAVSFCGHAIHGKDVFIVEDTLEDERFADNPLVTGEPHIRFYAGAPLQLGGGSSIGTLCLIDVKPRSLKPHQQRLLQDIAGLVSQEIQFGANDALQGEFVSSLSASERFHATDPNTRCWTHNAALEMLNLSLSDHRYRPAPSCLLALRIEGLPFLKTHKPTQFEILLVEASRRIRKYTGVGDLLATWGPGRWLLFIRDQRAMDAPELARLLTEEFDDQPVQTSGLVMPVSMFVAIVPLDFTAASDPIRLLSAAECGLEKAGDRGAPYETSVFH